jgi:uncharacterized protein (TIGR03437 family)
MRILLLRPLLLLAAFSNAIAQSSPYFITTAVGNGTRDFSGDSGPATSASLSNPGGVAIDAARNLYIADGYNNRIRKVTAAGTITTVAGSGNIGPSIPFNGPFSGDGGPATAAAIIQPSGVAIDSSGNLYIAEPIANRVRKVSILGTIATVVSGGLCSRFNTSLPNGPSFDGDGGLAATAQVSCPSGLAADSSGNLYIADTANNRIRKVTPAGIITTVAGSGPSNSAGGFSGDGGPATAAMLWGPSAVTVDASGTLYISDTQNNRIRKVTPAGIITTVAGSGPAGLSGSYGGDGGPATSAALSYPHGVAIDAGGNLYIADSVNNRIRKVTPAGTITTVAGTGGPGFGGDAGLAIAAQLATPLGVAIDEAGNLFVADYGNNRIRELSSGPAIAPNGIVNAASGVSGGVAPGEFVTIFGSGLGPGTPYPANGLAQDLANTRVLFNGIEAFTTYVSSSQINAIVPSGIAGSSQAELQIMYQGIKGNRATVPVAAAIPGIFTMNSSGTGQAVVLNQDGTFNSSANPATRGSVISFWATGQGQTNPPQVDGMQPQPSAFPAPVLPVSVSIGGITVPQGDVLFAGVVYAGILQVNVRVPDRALASNLTEILLTVGDAVSLKGVTLPAITICVR